MSKVTEMLKKYQSYKFAVNVYEKHKPVPTAGISNYSGMPGGSGAPERFFALVGKPADMGVTSMKDKIDYMRYKAAVVEIEGAIGILSDEQQSVIKLKWMHDMTLKQIAERKGYSIDTIKKAHRMALKYLTDALRFTQMPEIESHEMGKVSTF
ncbi:sigma-70 family RNA polymerase sigma factor [Paenibacillus sp. HWE-109]|uniref:sigma-70 family RNA polymerase sigma factor n=1 Tax=Paenibacillus sp. HWE-109 TaxID=1306526 RepID=UPI001EDF36B0|nr:sigma-70 family RNA polymerase sigma factor [Paenibacillus sp. HWE-109]UKS25034.1 sigma-70 family RNA polymerase sigma factor [Paenibacillus sp. HWE-109]